MARRSMNKTEISSEEMSKISASPEQITEMVRKKAYELYEKRGQKQGHELDDWLKAEKLITKRSF